MHFRNSRLLYNFEISTHKFRTMNDSPSTHNECHIIMEHRSTSATPAKGSAGSSSAEELFRTPYRPPVRNTAWGSTGKTFSEVVAEGAKTPKIAASATTNNGVTRNAKAGTAKADAKAGAERSAIKGKDANGSLAPKWALRNFTRTL
jgi:hypothetical protein